jgi:hypothetical protein
MVPLKRWDASAVLFEESQFRKAKRYRELPHGIAGSEQLGRDPSYNWPGQVGRWDNCDFQRATSFDGRSGNLPTPAMWIT